MFLDRPYELEYPALLRQVLSFTDLSTGPRCRAPIKQFEHSVTYCEQKRPPGIS
jgi:hypothetical protein